MKNFQGPGDVVDFVAPVGGVTAGVGYVIGNDFLVATTTASAGAIVAGAKKGVFRLPKHTSDAVTGKQIAYWDNTAKLVRAASASGRYIIGTVSVAQGASDTYVDVELNGIHVVAI